MSAYLGALGVSARFGRFVATADELGEVESCECASDASGTLRRGSRYMSGGSRQPTGPTDLSRHSAPGHRAINRSASRLRYLHVQPQREGHPHLAAPNISFTSNEPSHGSGQFCRKIEHRPAHDPKTLVAGQLAHPTQLFTISEVSKKVKNQCLHLFVFSGCRKSVRLLTVIPQTEGRAYMYNGMLHEGNGVCMYAKRRKPSEFTRQAMIACDISRQEPNQTKPIELPPSPLPSIT
jgi:hypothetical protein